MRVIKDLLRSKKFVGAMITMVTAIAIRLGMPETTVSEILALVSPMLAYIGAQGFADIGKESAVVSEAIRRINKETEA